MIVYSDSPINIGAHHLKEAMGLWDSVRYFFLSRRSCRVSAEILEALLPHRCFYSCFSDAAECTVKPYTSIFCTLLDIFSSCDPLGDLIDLLTASRAQGKLTQLLYCQAFFSATPRNTEAR